MIWIDCMIAILSFFFFAEPPTGRRSDRPTDWLALLQRFEHLKNISIIHFLNLPLKALWNHLAACGGRWESPSWISWAAVYCHPSATSGHPSATSGRLPLKSSTGDLDEKPSAVMDILYKRSADGQTNDTFVNHFSNIHSFFIFLFFIDPF